MQIFFIFFLVSGFCSLVYQVAWLRIAMADFGVTSTMISIVLSVFMAGLSLGSWCGGQAARRITAGNPVLQLRLYGALEFVIALSGLVSAPLLGLGQGLLASNFGAEWGSVSYYFSSGAIVFVVLFPFCFCMGATFPVAMASFRSLYPEKSANSFSYLYLANLVGAVIGCLGTAFVMIELLGFQGGMRLAAFLNFGIVLAALFLSRRLKSNVAMAAGSVAETGLGSVTPSGGKGFYCLLMLTGMSSMALEVIWTRQFTPFLGPVVYTFATILALFLAANFAGSSYYRSKSSLIMQHETTDLAVMTAIAGLAAILPLLMADYRLPISDGIVGGVLRVALAVVPFGFILGIVTPFVVDRLSAGDPERAGRAYSVNTAGCILGPFIAGFLLLPSTGERWSTVLMALPFFLLSPLLAAGNGASDSGRRSLSPRFTGALSACLLISMIVLTVTRDYETRFAKATVLRDHTATVVAAGAGMKRELLVNGYGMTVLTPITKMMVHLPMAIRVTPPKKGLVLCFGMGTSFRSMLSWGIPSTVVELVPGIPKLFGYFHEDAAQLLADPNAQVVVDDARRFLCRTKERFDVIVLDPPPPIEAAASSLLYSSEFYRLVAARLSEDGIFHQWTDTATADPYLMAAIVTSLAKVFPYVRAFSSIEGWGVHLLASKSPIPFRSPVDMASNLSPKAAKDMTEWGPYAAPVDQINAALAGELPVADLLRGGIDVRPIEDDRPVNEYFILRKLFSRNDHGG